MLVDRPLRLEPEPKGQPIKSKRQSRDAGARRCVRIYPGGRMSKAKSNGRRQLERSQTQRTPVRVKMGQDKSMALLGSRSTAALLTSSSLAVLLMAAGMPAAWAQECATVITGTSTGCLSANGPTGISLQGATVTGGILVTGGITTNGIQID